MDKTSFKMTIAETKVLIEARWLRYKLKFKHPIKLKCPHSLLFTQKPQIIGHSQPLFFSLKRLPQTRIISETRHGSS